MRPPWWRHYKINMAFHFGERLIIIVNSGGLISPRREWDERVQVNGNHARWDGVNRRDVEDWGFGTKNWVGQEKLNSHWTWGTIAVVCNHLWLVDLGNSANSAYLSNLQKVDQSFTAKDLGRDVIDICIGNRWYIGLTHVGIQRMLFVFQHSSNVIWSR